MFTVFLEEKFRGFVSLRLVAFNKKADESISSRCSNKKEEKTVLNTSLGMEALKSRDKKKS